MTEAIRRRIYVISDLHLGGKPYPADQHARDFRIFTETATLQLFIETLAKKPAGNPKIELVINGDFVDFLAERNPAGSSGKGIWSPVKTDAGIAARLFRKIAADEEPIFRALISFLEAGHRLTVLLGNHDIELSYPLVRRELEAQVGAHGHDFNFLYDGEAYVIGEEVLIEHGNRYDEYNRIDYDALRRVRSLQSRKETIPPEYQLQACPGSKLVSAVVNQIKEEYAFVNLLKPENEALLPILLAVVPDRRLQLEALAVFARDYAAKWRRVLPGRPPDGHIAGVIQPPLREALDRQLGRPEAQEFVDDMEKSEGWPVQDGGNIGGGTAPSLLQRARSLWDLLRQPSQEPLKKRLPALLHALRLWRNEKLFDWDKEPPKPYRNEAAALAGRGFRLVLFGHTHLARVIDLDNKSAPAGVPPGQPGNPSARAIDLDNKKWYLNTGTWANIIKFPDQLLSHSGSEAEAQLFSFLQLLSEGKFEKVDADQQPGAPAEKGFKPQLFFQPTFARVNLDGAGRLIPGDSETGLYMFKGAATV